MRIQKWIVGACLVLAGVLVMTGCNLPAGTAKPSTDELIQTAAAQTVSAMAATQTAAAPTAGSPTAVPSDTPVPSATPPAAPPTAQPVAATATVALPCNAILFVTDVTVPDGSKYAPGTSFTKTWRLKNTGTCPWTTAYKLVFDSGTQMDGVSSTALSGNVNPGDMVDLSVTLKAPATPGKYKSNWVLENAAGARFGLTGGGSFWADIEVVGNTATITPTITLTGTITNTPAPTLTPTLTPSGT